ncbi:uncharacterized protein LOC111251896 isoform X1 [Varroa destructor]|uniref:Uncharacterized protein n=1 Tax=Varroa destructor TaxID=109461 RepID=A0A7M7KCB0_VARDE|nr:uncharacterized protein LOC111251896 isoform X1 [Varroa destructor]
MNVLTSIIRKQQFQKRLQHYFKHVSALCERELNDMISKAISKANAREAEGRHVTVQTSIKVFLSKCLTLKDSLRSKMQNEILMTSNFISRTLIKQEPAECLPEIGDHIEAMCAEISAWWNFGLSRLNEDCRDFEKVKLMFSIIEEKNALDFTTTKRMGEDIILYVEETSLSSEASDLASETEPEYLKLLDNFECDEYPALPRESDESSKNGPKRNVYNNIDAEAVYSSQITQTRSDTFFDTQKEALLALRELKGLLNLLTHKSSYADFQSDVHNLSVDGDIMLLSVNYPAVEPEQDCASLDNSSYGGQAKQKSAIAFHNPFRNCARTKKHSEQSADDDDELLSKHEKNGKDLPIPIRQLAELIDFLEGVFWPLTETKQAVTFAQEA